MADDRENLNVLRSAGAAGVQSSAEGLTRRVEGNQRIGRSGLTGSRSRLYHYDRVQGLAGAQMKMESDQTDRMSDAETRDMLSKLHEAYQVSNEVEGYLYDFDYAMFVCYALNGSSQLGPFNRVSFRVVRNSNDGMAPRIDEYDYATVHTICDVDMRRFFRAMVNDVIDACRHLYKNFDVNDPYEIDLRAKMIMLAQRRALGRHPYLLADGSDAATNISEVEHSAIMSSKQFVVSATTNAVDQISSARVIRSSDGYDSSVGRNVPTAVDVHSSTPVYHS